MTSQTHDSSIRIARIDACAYRVAIARPVATSFGVMRDRPAVFLRLEDEDGCFGLGEIFANWPAAGAEHRVRLLAEDIADLVLDRPFDGHEGLYPLLTRLTRIRALQCGEWGPFRQVIAGLDTAFWDLRARRQGVPLRRLIDKGAADRVDAYASGIDIRRAEAVTQEARSAGHRAFKVKIGLGAEDETETVHRLAQTLAPRERLFADANQAWDLDAALAAVRALEGAGLGWLEEPLAADAPDAHWKRLARHSTVPLAGGENIAGEAAFAAAVGAGSLRFVQPDLAKWGGVTGCLEVARRALAAGRIYCPHFLGGGIGLRASAQLLAAVGGPGLLEIDVNPNPLRDAFGPLALADGAVRLDDAPGLGIEAVPESLSPHLTLHRSRHRRER